MIPATLNLTGYDDLDINDVDGIVTNAFNANIEVREIHVTFKTFANWQKQARKNALIDRINDVLDLPDDAAKADELAAILENFDRRIDGSIEQIVTSWGTVKVFPFDPRDA